ncbi:hypothetical protein HJFPF1_11904 [Paramyrothecium foliicola]|nr:hypothetical protein HJFPF1_11904 [Paramyrothecium foliicola]
MDRDRNNAPGAAARPGNRPSSQLLVKHEGRKPLFTSTTTNTTARSVSGSTKDDASATKSRGGLFNRRTNSDSQAASTTPATRRGSNSSVGSSGSTRIPRPSSTAPSFLHRRQMSLAEAYKLAEEEEKAELEQPGNGSPSPAPRPWRNRQASDEVKMRKLMSEDHLDSKKGGQLARRPSTAVSTATDQDSGRGRNGESPGKFESNATVDTRQSTGRIGGPGATSRERSTDWRSRTRVSSGLFSSRGTTPKDGHDGGTLPSLVPGIEDMPLPSIEPPAQSHQAIMSPEKSFAWQVDQDFTAGDLTVSDSPRIRFGYQPAAARTTSNDRIEAIARTRSPLKSTFTSRNTKLDEIRALETDVGASGQAATPRTRQRNSKLDEIRAREQEVESRIPLPDRNQPRPKNTKLDEIRQREVDGIPKRALAAVRLEEIREQNLLSRSLSRSLSPEVEMRPQSSREPVVEAAINIELEPNPPLRPKSAFEIGGERIPDTPVTIFKTRRGSGSVDKEEKKGDEAGKPAASTTPNEEAKTSDHRDLLRRLARATSASPAPEPEVQKPPPPPPVENTEKGDQPERLDRPERLEKIEKIEKPERPERPERAASERTRWRSRNGRLNAESGGKTGSSEAKDTEVSRPTVEFAGLRRVRSTESTKSKRYSMHSEDPVDRIDSEMKLFAPAENHSERGSVRAPSPKSDDDRDEDDEKEGYPDEPEATPRPRKHDVLSMPTPKVTGAYVETPATVKVEDKFTIAEQPILQEKKQPSIEPATTLRERKPAIAEPTNILRERKPHIIQAVETLRERKLPSTEVVVTQRERRRASARRTRLSDTASDPGSEDKDVAVTTSAAVRKPRARSLPRRRPLLRNTAKPHTVKDDLLELQRVHNIDDSTLEDLEGILFGRKRNNSVPKPEDLLKDLSESETADQKDPDLRTDSETDQAHTVTSELRRRFNEKDHSDGELAAYDRMSKSLRTGLMGIRTAKQGIERLEDRVSHSHSHMETKPIIETMENDLHTHKHHDHAVYAAVAHVDTPYAWSYIYIPVPRLYRSTPRFRFTLLGLLVLLFSIWFTAESTMCALYCRPTTCSSEPCIWSFDDPSFGNAIPVKLDQWATGGRGRFAYNAFVEQAQDRVADVLDDLLDRDITHPDYTEGMSFTQRRQHWRRLQAKGLLRGRPEPSAEDRAKWEAWERVMKADERAAEAREMGYVIEDGDAEASIGGDVRID